MNFKLQFMYFLSVVNLLILFFYVIFQVNFVRILHTTSAPTKESISKSQKKQHRYKTTDLYISIKTTQHNHELRIPLILKTWYNWAPKETYLVTDQNDTAMHNVFGDRLIVTKCQQGHGSGNLKCKLLAEFNGFFREDKKWWCHVDDDTYVNVPKLLEFLDQYDYTEKVVLGRISLNRPYNGWVKDKQTYYWFATGGAGYCFSKTIMEEMREPMNKMFMRLITADDVSLFYISEVMCKTRMTMAFGFHSHLPLLRKHIPDFAVTEQITLSYHGNNTVYFPGKFNTTVDPSRFLSIFCAQEPSAPLCK